jgi:hypothetical protein
MSRKLILSLASAATIAVVALGSSSADARGFGGGGFGGGHFGGGRINGSHFAGRGGGRLIPILNPGRSGHPGHPRFPGYPGFPRHPGHWAGHYPHGHWVFRNGGWIAIDEAVDVTPAVVPAPGPCTCLTKNYTPDGLVVFADMCTKESASAPVDGRASDATQVPTPSNYAGKTYDDYLAANPQAASQAPQKN